MTYQRNKLVSCFALRVAACGRPSGRRYLQNGFDQGFPDGVEEAEVAPGDDDEAEHDRGSLTHLAAVRPLDATQLVDAVPEEGDDPVARAAAAVAFALAPLLDD